MKLKKKNPHPQNPNYSIILILTPEIQWYIFDCILTKSMDLYGNLKLEPSHGIDV